MLTDGKFVTTGIKFDVSKATIKPESIGTINYVAKMMTDHPDLKFCIEGHTDSDGADDGNQTLSEKRAEAVRKELIKLGIDSTGLLLKDGEKLSLLQTITRPKASSKPEG